METSSPTSSSEEPQQESLFTKSLPWKLFLLFLAVNPLLGLYYNYDVVGAAGPTLISANLTTTIQLGFLYTAYYAPNVLTAYFLGLLIDRIGLRYAAPLLLLPPLAGSAVVTLGVHFGAFWGMVLGRVLVGLGDTAIVVQITMIGVMFSPAWRDVAFGVLDVWSHVGSFVVFLVVPALTPTGLTLAVATASAFMASALATNLTFALLEPRLRQAPGAPRPKARMADLKQLPISFWLMLTIVSLHQSLYWTGMSFAELFLTEQGLAQETAGLVVSLTNLTVLLAPLLSWLISRSHHRCVFWCVSSALLVLCYLLMALSVVPVLFVLLQGLSYTMLNPTVLASIPVVVDERVLGSSYGMNVVVYNVFAMVFPVVIGGLREYFGGWVEVYLFLMGMAVVELGCVVVLTYMEYKNHFLSTTKQKYMIVKFLKREKEINNEPIP